MFTVKDRNNKTLTFQETLYKVNNRICNWFLDFELLLLRWIGLIPLHFIRLFFYRLAGVKISRGSKIHMWANFYQPKGIIIGQDSIIGDHCFLDGRAPLKIGNHVALASQVLVYNSEHNINDEHFSPIEEPVEIEDYVFIGPRAIVLPGVKIGKGAVVGAGAVVTKDIPPLTIVGGVPAKEIGKRKVQKLNYQLGRARLFQ